MISLLNKQRLWQIAMESFTRAKTTTIRYPHGDSPVRHWFVDERLLLNVRWKATRVETTHGKFAVESRTRTPGLIVDGSRPTAGQSHRFRIPRARDVWRRD